MLYTCNGCVIWMQLAYGLEDGTIYPFPQRVEHLKE